MAWHPEPGRTRLGNRNVVVLSPDDYQRLETIRRQAGAQASRVSALPASLRLRDAGPALVP
jgi:hypothetical protein